MHVFEIKGWKLFKCSFKKCFLVNIYRAEGKDVQVVTLNDLCKVQWFINQDLYIQTHTDDVRDSVSRVLVNSKMTFHSDILF